MKIEDSVMAVLGRCSTEGNVLHLPAEQLDRKLYVSVNKVLEAMGGKWNRKAGGHVFADTDPEEALFSAISTGEVTDAKKEFQFFETPAELAERLCDMAELDGNSIVLEPSCGSGRIADAAWARHPAKVSGVEINTELARCLQEKPYDVQFWDFLELDIPEAYRPNRIVMNPPFSNHQDARHVLRAYDVLLPGGILVSVVSPAFKFRTDKEYTAFREFISSHNAEVIDLPENTFKSSGTSVRTCIIKISKEE